MSEPVAGKRYSHLYISRGEPAKDSPKVRYRLGLLADAVFPAATTTQIQRGYNLKKELTNLIQQEVGVQFRTAKGRSVVESWPLFFKKISIIELLDTLTIIISPHYEIRFSDESRHRFRDEATRILREENLAFTIDEQGGIHPLVDTAFTQATNATIVGLAGTRYNATLQMVEKIDGYLLQEPSNYVAAIRSVFGACENLFKLMYGGPRLDAKSATEKLTTTQQRLYEGYPTMQRSSAKLLYGFKEWIDAAHFYRHEEGDTEPGQPESEIALLLISEGLSYVRWLAAIDRKNSITYG